MNEKERRTAFEALVLQGIWLLVRLLKGEHLGTGWLADAISHLDVVGNQAGGAKEHRREKAFPYPPY